MSDATLVVDLDPRVRIIGSLLGQSRSRRRGQSQDVVGSREYVPGDDVRRIDWSASARLSSTTGEERFVVVKARPVVGADGAPKMAINVIEDITEQKRAEERFRFLSETSDLLASSLERAADSLADAFQSIVRISSPG